MSEQLALPTIRNWTEPVTCSRSEFIGVLDDARRDGYQAWSVEVVKEGYCVEFFKVKESKSRIESDFERALTIVIGDKPQ